MIKYFVYYLRDPRTQEIRWVGETKNPSRRLSRHLSCDGRYTEMDAWIMAILQTDDIPILDVIYVADSREEAVQVETTHIKQLRDAGVSLLNRADGGRGGRGLIHSPEHLAQRSEAIRRAMTPQVCQKISEAVSKAWTPALRAQYGAAHAKIWTEAKREEHSQIMREALDTPEHRDRLSKKMTNIWATRYDEMCQKIREGRARELQRKQALLEAK